MLAVNYPMRYKLKQENIFEGVDAEATKCYRYSDDVAQSDFYILNRSIRELLHELSIALAPMISVNKYTIAVAEYLNYFGHNATLFLDSHEITDEEQTKIDLFNTEFFGKNAVDIYTDERGVSRERRYGIKWDTHVCRTRDLLLPISSMKSYDPEEFPETDLYRKHNTLVFPIVDVFSNTKDECLIYPTQLLKEYNQVLAINSVDPYTVLSTTFRNTAYGDITPHELSCRCDHRPENPAGDHARRVSTFNSSPGGNRLLCYNTIDGKLPSTGIIRHILCNIERSIAFQNGYCRNVEIMFLSEKYTPEFIDELATAFMRKFKDRRSCTDVTLYISVRPSIKKLVRKKKAVIEM